MRWISVLFLDSASASAWERLVEQCPPLAGLIARGAGPGPSCYTVGMLDEVEFRSLAEIALETLKQHLYVLEEDENAGFEVEEQNGVLNVIFADPSSKFVITPNTAVRQIWISALSTSFKLDWDEDEEEFYLPRNGEFLIPLVDRLIQDCLQR